MGINKQILSAIKKWGIIEWIINLRYIGYFLILLHAYLKMDISKEEYIGYGGRPPPGPRWATRRRPG